MTLSEVARRTGLSPATARRSLTTLAHLGYVRQINGRYLLGARILSLGSAYLRSSAAGEILEPELHKLAAQFGDSAGIAILAGVNVLYVAYSCNSRGVRPVAGAGVTFPAMPTSLGRVLLAGQPDRELEEWFRLARFEKHTELTETDPRRLRAIIKRVRMKGFATIRDELFYGVTSLAVPILSASGKVIAALNTSGYSGLVTETQLIRERLSHLQGEAAELSRLIARYPVLLNSLATDVGNKGVDKPSLAPKSLP